VTSIFISYSSTNVEVGTRLRDLLAKRGYAAVFRDKDPEHGIAAGTRWAAELYSNLERADVIVFIATEASLASPWCHTELAVGVARGKHIVQVSQEKVPVHRVLADRQAMAPEPDLDRLVDALIDNLSAVGFGPADQFSWDADRSPYPGLGRLERDHAAVLFGRDAEVGACIQRMNGPRPLPLLVSGPSGSGKSSMVRAGVLPRLERVEGTRILPDVEPGDSPLQRVGLAFATNQGEADAASLIADPKGLAFAVDRAVAAGATRVVLFIDQAEDLLTRADKAQVTDLMARLQAVDPDRLVVIAAVRSMSLDAWLQEPALAWLGQADPVWVRPLRREALREVIVRPAHIAGIRFEPDTLVDRIVEDTTQGNALPLLAALLEELAEGHSRLSPAVITAKRYDEIGPVSRVIERRALEATTYIGARRKIPEAAVIDAFLRLVDVDDDGRVTGADVVLDDIPEDVRVVFEDLERFRLVSRDQRIVGGTTGPDTTAAAGRYVDVARAVHEEVFRAWPAVDEAIRTRRTDLATRTWLRHDAQAWDNAKRGQSSLAGGQLTDARSWRERNPGDVTPLVDDYINAAVGQARRRQLLTVAVPVLAVVALAVGVLAFQAYSEAQRANTARAEADALRLAGDARATFDSRPDLGLLLAMEAAARSDAPQLKGMPLAALTHGPSPHRIVDIDDEVSTAAFDRRGSHAVLRAPDKVVLWDVEGEAAAGTLPASSGAVAISGDGSTVALGTPEGVAIHPWAAPEPGARCPVGVGTLLELALSDDGSLVAVVSEDPTSPESVVTLLDTETCDVTSSLTGVPGEVRGVAFDQSGELIALGTEDHGAGVWDVANGELIKQVGEDSETVRTLTFGNDETLAWATDDGNLHVVDIADPESSQEFLVHGGDQVDTLAFSAVDDAFLSGAATGEMRRVKPSGASPVGEAFQALPPLDYPGEAFRLRGLAADGPRGVSVDSAGRVVEWQLDGRPKLGKDLTGGHTVELAASAADGSVIASDGAAIWRVDAGGEERPIAERSGITVLETNESGWAAGTNEGEILTGRASPDSVQTIRTIPEHRVTAIAGLPDGGWAAVLEKKVGEGGSIVVIPVDGDPVEADMTATPASLAVGDGRLYVGDMVGTIHEFAVDDLRPAGEVAEAHDFDIASMALSPDGSLLATGSDDRTIALWNVADDGELAPRSRLRGHEERVRSLAFSPDGHWLASADEAPVVRYWDLAAEQPVGDAIDVGPAPVVAFDRSADRQLLVADGHLSSWEMRAEEWPKIACGILGTRRLDDAERAQYLGGEAALAACP
jgi:conflict system STAND superfamily ATPase/TIR domain-containing protein/WD40 domain-containing protein